jgi:GTP-binding protein HflX
MAEMIRAVEDVLAGIGAAERPQLLALNKVDVLDAAQRRELRFRHPHATQLSAATGEGLDDLRSGVEAEFRRTLLPMDLLVPYREGGRLAELHDLAGELEREDTPEGARVRARVPAGVAQRFERFSVGGEGNGGVPEGAEREGAQAADRNGAGPGDHPAG